MLYIPRSIYIPAIVDVYKRQQEGDAVIHFERAFPLELEIADGIERTRKVALLFQFSEGTPEIGNYL